MGYDAHALADGMPLVLGGVELDYPSGLAGHSDGDVIAHALIDAVLGAAGLGDIGGLFRRAISDSAGSRRSRCSRRRTRSDSRRLAARERRLCAHRRGAADRGPSRRDAPSVRRRDREGEVNVRATTTDHLGFPGRGRASRLTRWPCSSVAERRPLRRPARSARAALARRARVPRVPHRNSI